MVDGYNWASPISSQILSPFIACQKISFACCLTEHLRREGGRKESEGRPGEHSKRVEGMRKDMGLMGFVGCLMMAAGAGLLMVNKAAAADLMVGGKMGWTIPPNGTAYPTWASSQNFRAGDTLVFNWTGTHNVAEVSKDDYDGCKKTPINDVTLSKSPANFTLNAKDTSRYFICTVGPHCTLGQKVAIKMGSSESGTSGSNGISSSLAILISMIIASLTHM